MVLHDGPFDGRVLRVSGKENETNVPSTLTLLAPTPWAGR